MLRPLCGDTPERRNADRGDDRHRGGAQGRQAAIAADTLTSFGEKRYSAAHKARADKIVRIGESHVGMAGSPAHRQVIDSTFTTAPETARFTYPQAIFEYFRAHVLRRCARLTVGHD
jgi:hypothetical protein